jgi:hypothetical protein
VSDLSVTVHNFESLLEGKSTFSQFQGQEVALFKQNIASLAPALQGAANMALESFEAGASSLVGAGLTAIGPILAQSSDAQATLVLNLLGLMGVPTTGTLSVAEHAALTTAINGLKAGLDKIGLQIATNGSVTVTPTARPGAPPPVTIIGDAIPQ